MQGPGYALYPPIEPYDQGMLEVSGGHQIYFEQSGNAGGVPVLVVHGGPGGGSNPTMRRFHDPARHRIVMFDQRGCGRSKPFASLDENTTGHLVDDMERLRCRLGVSRWQLFGGSWGSTLSLAYALTHPYRVSGLILRGVFLMRRAELAWFYQDGCNWLFPEAWQSFVDIVPDAERDDVIAAYHRRLTGDDLDLRRRAAAAWSRWEAETLSLWPDPARVEQFADERFALAFARIEAHYFVNAGFFPCDGYLLEEAPRLAGIPGIIVQGRYDVVTPPRSAVELHRAWPGSELEVIEAAGHALSEPGIARALVAATARLEY
ncbi:MAG: prolyl aminopeptidase [Hyphomicrobiaceae bacterium]